jgi:hypothetical protein
VPRLAPSSVVPTAPWPHALWSICGAMLGMSPKRMPIANHKRTSVIYRPVSLFVLGGHDVVKVPPPLCSKARRSLRSRPNQVSRQDPAGQQSWTCVCPTARSICRTLLLHTAHTRHAQPPIKANMARPLSRMIVSSAWPCAPNNKVGQGQSYCLKLHSEQVSWFISCPTHFGGSLA